MAEAIFPEKYRAINGVMQLGAAGRDTIMAAFVSAISYILRQSACLRVRP